MSTLSEAAFPTPLVSTDWLTVHLDDPGLRIVDMRKGDGYAVAHIPGAVAVEASPFLREDGDVIGATSCAELMSRLGLDRNTTVVGYDDGNGLFAARLWWVLNLYGHPRVAMLDGGWDLWLAENRPVSSTPVTPTRTAFEAIRDERWIASTEYVHASLGRADRVLLDVRGHEEWSRTESTSTATAGHIPGAHHLVWTDLLEAGTKRFKHREEVRRLFTAAGADGQREIITYCQGGIRAAHSMLALKAAGYGDVRNYEGSWAAWTKAGLPREGHAT